MAHVLFIITSLSLTRCFYSKSNGDQCDYAWNPPISPHYKVLENYQMEADVGRRRERGGLLATWLVRVQNHQAHVERDLIIMFKAGTRSHGSAHLKIFKTMKDKTS
ncbi:hypothetical protein BDE02_05G061100 [Populus trichocarpa]|nr:hypothetical protein BDE02_05G061100 [Populus trichocarpa]